MLKTERVSLVPSGVQAAKGRSYAFTVGICATGRPPSLAGLLSTVLSSEMPGFTLKKVVMVASACSSETLATARAAASEDRRMKLIEHEGRAGKADALNEVFREADGDFLVYVNADATIGPNSIPALLKSIVQGQGFGFISGQPVFRRPQGLISDVLDLMWTSFNLLSADPRHANQANHGTDELMVIRRSLLPELPMGVVNDGAYIAGRVRERGFRVGFQPKALVQIDVPRRMVDLISQRRRILFGHIQVKRLVGKAPRTVETMMFFSPLSSIRIVIRELASKPRLIVALPAAGIGELVAVCGALWDTTTAKNLAIWKRYDQ